MNFKYLATILVFVLTFSLSAPRIATAQTIKALPADQIIDFERAGRLLFGSHSNISDATLFDLLEFAKVNAITNFQKDRIQQGGTWAKLTENIFNSLVSRGAFRPDWSE